MTRHPSAARSAPGSFRGRGLATGRHRNRGLIPGASQGGDASDQDLDTILKAFQVKGLVLGHSTLDQITAFHDGRVFGIDAGLQHPGHGELWLWEKGRIYRGLLDGRRLPLPRSLSM